MKKKLLRIGAMIAVMAGLVLGAMGCGKEVTPQSLLDDMEEKIAKENNFSLNMLMECIMSGEIQEGTTMDLTMDIDLDMEVVSDPESMHGKGTISLGVLGMSQNMDMEMYMVQEDGDYVMYTGMTGATGDMLDSDVQGPEWTREVLEKEDITSGYDVSGFSEFADAFELEEDLETVNDEDCYVLSGNVSGESLEGILEASMAAMDSAGEMFDSLDADDIELPIKLYLSKSTGLPVQMTMDMADLMTQAMQSEADMTCSKCDYTMTYTGFGDVDDIEVPDDVKEAAGNSDNDDSDDDMSDFFESSEEETEPESKVETDGVPLTGVEQTGELGTNWDSYSVQINGKVLNLPCTYEEFMSQGFYMDTDDDFLGEDDVVNANDYELGFVYADPDSYDYISVCFYNNSDQPKKVSECLIGGIEVDKYFVESSGMDIVFPGGIKVGSTPDDLTAAYGESMEKNVGSDLDRYGWLDLDSYYKYLDVTVENETNLIYSIELSNMD